MVVQVGQLIPPPSSSPSLQEVLASFADIPIGLFSTPHWLFSTPMWLICSPVCCSDRQDDDNRSWSSLRSIVDVNIGGLRVVTGGGEAMRIGDGLLIVVDDVAVSIVVEIAVPVAASTSETTAPIPPMSIALTFPEVAVATVPVAVASVVAVVALLMVVPVVPVVLVLVL